MSKSDMRMVEIIQASGHPKIKARHRTTLEITKDIHLTERGDCIVAIHASKGAADLSPRFSWLMKNDNTRVTLTIKARSQSMTVRGRGDSRLTLSHPTDLVVRKSRYVCTRTLMVQADGAASDMPRSFVMALQDASSRITIEIIAEVQDA